VDLTVFVIVALGHAMKILSEGETDGRVKSTY